MNITTKLAGYAAVLIASIVLQNVIFRQAEAIAEKFAPTYIPMSKEELIKIYPDYFENRRFGPEEQYYRMMHESQVKIASLTASHHRAVFYEKYVKDNKELIETIVEYVFAFLYLLMAISLMKYLYSYRRIALGIGHKLAAILKLKEGASALKVKVAAGEFDKLKKLHENGLISDQDFEKKKVSIAQRIKESLN